MIRTVPIPKGVSRMGCAPGGNCCDDCRKHGTLGDTPDVTTTISYDMGDGTTCDQDGNCYTNGVLVSAPLTTQSGCPAGTQCGMSGTAMYILGGLLLVALIGSTNTPAARRR